MRIAVITNAYPPQAHGGAGEVAARLADLWRQSGHKVQVWHKRAAWLERPFAIRIIAHLLDAFQVDSKITASVRSFQPDVIISHNLTGIGLRTPHRAAQECAVPWIHVLHDIQLFEPSGQASHDRRTLLQRCATRYRRLFWHDPDVVVSPTDWLLRAHRQRGWFSDARTVVIPNPLPWEVDARASAPEDYYLFVGRWSRDKGADVIRAMASESKYPFVAIGPGTEGIAEERIYGKGPLAHEELVTWFARARAVVVPSQILENQPTVILEAFAFGVPVIASALGGMPETVGDAGILCKHEDRSAWTRAVLDLEGKIDDYRARAAVQAKRFASKQISRDWEELFRPQDRSE